MAGFVLFEVQQQVGEHGLDTALAQGLEQGQGHGFDEKLHAHDLQTRILHREGGIEQRTTGPVEGGRGISEVLKIVV